MKRVLAVLVNLIAVCDLAPSAVVEVPETWRSYCKVSSRTGKDTIECSLYKGQMIDYRDVRNWTATETGKSYEVLFVCAGGTVFLPWPFKASNVVSLEVKGCIIEGFLSEMTTVNTIPDQLKSLVISDVSIEANFRDIFSTLKNIAKITKSADCGQLTVEKLVFVNIHYEIKMSPEERHSGMAHHMISQNGESLLTHAHDHFCKYSNLKYLDESGSRTMGVYHWKLLTENSQFPKLQVYRLSNNSFGHVPEELKNLNSKKFPKLTHLDLSDNALVEFEFILPDKPTTTSVTKLVDLRRNHIKSISATHSNQLKELKSVMVDLRENPLACECTLSSFRQYLKQQYKKIHLRQIVSEITCKTKMREVPSKTVEYSLLDPKFDKHCVK